MTPTKPEAADATPLAAAPDPPAAVIDDGTGQDEKVLISHPEIPGAYGEVTRLAFDVVWKAKGFSIVDEADADPDWRRPSTPSE